MNLKTKKENIMKTLILTLTLTTLFSSAFAGVLENRKTGETIELTLLKTTREIDILSTAIDLPNSRLKMKKINQGKTDGYSWDFYLTPWTLETPTTSSGQCYNMSCDGVGVQVVLFPIAFTIDVAANLVKTPFKLIGRAIKNKRVKKDFTTIMEVVTTQKTISTNRRRFERIVNSLNLARKLSDKEEL